MPLSPSSNELNFFILWNLLLATTFVFFYFLRLFICLKMVQQINVKNCYVHPEHGTGIRTHDLSNMSRLP